MHARGVELESEKLGVVLLILGGMHFFNILVFAKMRQRHSGQVSYSAKPLLNREKV